MLWKNTTWYDVWLILKLVTSWAMQGGIYYQNQRMLKQQRLLNICVFILHSRNAKWLNFKKLIFLKENISEGTILTAFSELKRLSFTTQETSLSVFRTITCKISIKTPFIILELLVRDKQVIFCGRGWYWSHRGHHLVTSLKTRSLKQMT